MPFFELIVLLTAADPTASAPLSTRDALAPLNVLIGSWRGTGAPEGTKEERAAGAWSETIEWVWQFKGADAWLAVTFEKGKHFTKGELRYSPAKDSESPRYSLSLTAADKTTATYVGVLTDKILALNRMDGPPAEDERLVVSLLHHNRYLYRLESRPAGSTVAYTRKFQVGATKEGVPFADVPKGPECVVSGGLGTIRVRYGGKEYWVCCSGCRDEFKENAEKYVKEYEAKAKKP